MSPGNKRVFDTDNALKATFNRRFGRYQIAAYFLCVFAYSVISGWIANLLDYNRIY